MTHRQAKAELQAGTPPEAICATCPWDRFCVEPPTMSSQQIEELTKEAERKDREQDPDGKKMPLGMLLTTMTFAGKDMAGNLCPVFVLRLRGPGGRDIADGLRKQMRDWSES